MPVNRRLSLAFNVLLVMILGLMALGAGVRAMNAGISCPDWPLCFGKVIPDFHPAVWFEFVHRAYAGLTSLVFLALFGIVMFSKSLPRAAKIAMSMGLFFLFMQIAAGALTVLWAVKWFAVTAHLILATLFFLSVLWAALAIDPRVRDVRVQAPGWMPSLFGFLSVIVFAQIFMGGVVASTYAGSVCVDWPLCNGQWVPTWTGAIGHQIIHRFFAYGIALAILGLATLFHFHRNEPWMTKQFRNLLLMLLGIVVMQVALGVINLLTYIPPSVTVPHQTMGIILLASSVRLFQVTRVMARG